VPQLIASHAIADKTDLPVIPAFAGMTGWVAQKQDLELGGKHLAVFVFDQFFHAVSVSAVACGLLKWPFTT
jgi:hypothetical protein